MDRFSEMVSIVTGAGSGIGRSASLAFAQEGAAVAVIDRNYEAASSTAGQITEAGGTAAAWRTDVRDGSEINAMVRGVVEKWRRIDILFSNAGISVGARVCEMPEDMWDDVLDTNLKGAWLCAKAVIPHIRKAGGGAIVYTGSVHSNVAVPGAAAYAASKAGLLGLTRAMALELAPDNIRVNAVLPGSTDTPLMWDAVGTAQLSGRERQVAERAWHESVPLGRVAQADEIAAAALFLASREASYITGTSILVDGGALARLASPRDAE